MKITITPSLGEKRIFNTRLFREQLCYFEYINYTEKVDYLLSTPPTDEEIRAFLLEKALE